MGPRSSPHVAPTDAACTLTCLHPMRLSHNRPQEIMLPGGGARTSPFVWCVLWVPKADSQAYVEGYPRCYRITEVKAHRELPSERKQSQCVSMYIESFCVNRPKNGCVHVNTHTEWRDNRESQTDRQTDTGLEAQKTKERKRDREI